MEESAVLNTQIPAFAYKANFLEHWIVQVHCHHLRNLKNKQKLWCLCPTPRCYYLISLGCSLTSEFFKAIQVILTGIWVWEPLYQKTFFPLLRIFSLNTERIEWGVPVLTINTIFLHEEREMPFKEQTWLIWRFSGALSILHRKAGQCSTVPSNTNHKCQPQITF